MFTLGIVTNNHEENENEASQHSIRSAYQFSSPSYYFFSTTDTLIEKSNNQMKSAMKSLSHSWILIWDYFCILYSVIWIGNRSIHSIVLNLEFVDRKPHVMLIIISGLIPTQIESQRVITYPENHQSVLLYKNHLMLDWNCVHPCVFSNKLLMKWVFCYHSELSWQRWKVHHLVIVLVIGRCPIFNHKSKFFGHETEVAALHLLFWNDYHWTHTRL